MEEAKDWRDAVRMSCEPLEADGSVTAKYKEEIIRAVEQYGPYIIIMPNVAIPHAQKCTDSVKKTAVSFLKLKKPVCFVDSNQNKNYVQNFFGGRINPCDISCIGCQIGYKRSINRHRSGVFV